MSLLSFTDPQALITKFDELKASPDFFICYFTGGVDEASGKSWCPDCDVARPGVQKTVIDQTKLQVLKGVVDDRNTWVGVADHPYKAHPVFRAGGVPCLLLLKGEQVLVRIEDEKDFQNPELLEQLVNPQD
uniref:Thioredoxin domain-containing protein n=1 Tax=Strombidium rassoulzadegani TaxID=1082188 RepID=A0A7S3CHV6_9SPIT|mmetsp:Transcript_11002/g.18391  ORF Transcript_11002/g.18391 Transcript_11002/m.18391 type:complete len:131 (+) Transcript_11002:25-417(+)